MRFLRNLNLACFAFGIAFAGSGQASALTKEQAIEGCRNSVGHPIVQRCMRGGRDLESCREQAKPQVHACAMAALNKANGRANVAVPLPAETRPSEAVTKQAEALPVGFAPPPRTIADITAILDNEKPDPAQIAKLRAEADAVVPAKASREALARFYNDRGNARATLGRLQDATADAVKAVDAGRGAVDANLMGRLDTFLGLQYQAAGDPRRALEISQRVAREQNVPGAKGYLFGAYRQISSILISMGDIALAEAYLRSSVALLQEARTSGLPGWRSNYAVRGQSWESDVELNRALIFEARGQFREAENSFRVAAQRRRASIKGVMSAPNPPSLSTMLLAADLMELGEAKMKAKQGRHAEAEAGARTALLSHLKDQGKYNPTTPRFIMGLASILIDQGRYGEAEHLARASLEIIRTVGVAEDSQSNAQIFASLAGFLNLQRKDAEAEAVYAELDKAIAGWPPQARQRFDIDSTRIRSLYASGQTDRGIAAAQALLKKNIAGVGEKHYYTATARGLLAIGYMRACLDAEAASEFRAAIPVLMTAARENADDDDTTVVAARTRQLRDVAEAYITLLSRGPASDAAAAESFTLADSIRGRSVQLALAASTARVVANDPALADVVRREQDLTKGVNAQLGLLNNVLALPSNERDETRVKAISASIGKLRDDRDRLRAEIGRRFPNYADLIDPKGPSVEEIQLALKPDEALLSFYFGERISFVWGVPKHGKVAFAAIRATSGEIESKVHALRTAIEPQGASVSDIPPFDFGLAYELYSLLLAPVEAGWKPAKSLIVATNGALGELPLSMLTTAPATVGTDDSPLFAGYRTVPWLVRTHAVSMVPAAAALRTLRQIPPTAAAREPFLGFGDPIFSVAEAAQAEVQDDTSVQLASLSSRGLPLPRRSSPKTEGVDSAELALLPRLPDTAEELRAIAIALHADPAKVLRLGKAANEEAVKTADLSRYRVIAFATHGLMPGELNGLMQPALALSSPEVAGVPGDGLLTMEEILALKLDTDWVVLSACNTGAGAGAGAEAASGLGRAFFYAGTRAILVTNWSVHSQSARELVSDLFRRQANDPGLGRAEALRQAMVALLDGKGIVDQKGETILTYAHPLFWAPYSIIGDGG